MDDPTSRTYPRMLRVSGTGTWKIRQDLWQGTVSGTLTGAAVRVFIDAMEAGDTKTATGLVAILYDDGNVDDDSTFAAQLDLSETNVDISYE